MTNRSTRPSNRQQKPYPEFPLTAHHNGQWCKKHKGRRYYFGPVADWEAALARYEAEWPGVVAGVGQQRSDDPDSGARLTIAELCNLFLDSKERKLNSGEISPRTYQDADAVCAAIVKHFGKTRDVADLKPGDFERLRTQLAKRHSLTNLKNIINRWRGVFKFAAEHDDDHLPRVAVNFGNSFNRPTAKTIRKARNSARREGGLRMFEADELRLILDALVGDEVTARHTDDGEPVKLKMEPDAPMRAMILLAVNCGLGNTDIGTMPQSAVDLDGGWLDFPREKTAIERRVPLWMETVKALREAFADRPNPKSRADDALAFLTAKGARWTRIKTHHDDPGRYVPVDALSPKFKRLITALGINGRRGLGFYSLRHTFATIAGDSKDPDAVSAVMGHIDASVGGLYRERIPDERLRAVVDTVRRWLFGRAAGK